MHRTIERILRANTQPVSPYLLALFRIALGSTMLFELLRTSPSLFDLFGPNGFLQNDLMEMVTQAWAIPIDRVAAALHLPYRWLLGGIFGAQIVFLSLFIVGIRTRWAAGGVWAIQTVFMNTGFLSIYGLDRYFHAFIFVCLFAPLDSVWSWESARRGPRPEPTTESLIALRVLQIVLLATYLIAGAAKMRGTDWWTGDAIWRAVNVPDFRQWDMLWLAHFPVALKLLCWGTLALEGGYFFAVWIPGLRRPWALGVITLHIGIAIFMGLRLFGASLVIFNAILFLLPEGYTPRAGRAGESHPASPAGEALPYAARMVSTAVS
jgi:hypothetical protein